MNKQSGLDNPEILEVLEEIRNLLIPISYCFKEKYLEIRRDETRERLGALEELLTPVRRKIFPLLFAPEGVKQVELAKQAETNQPNVSRLISILLEQGFIEQVEDNDGNVVFKDIYGLRELI
jgi:hypothetical protein